MANQLQFMPQTAWQLGEIAPGAKLFLYVSGTTTPVTAHTDVDYSTPHAFPIVADAAGMFPAVFFSGAAEVKAVIVASDDSAIATIDPVPKVTTSGAGASTVSFSPVAGNPTTDVQAAIAHNTGEIATLETGKADVNLSNLASYPAARTNLGLGASALLGVSSDADFANDGAELATRETLKTALDEKGTGFGLRAFVNFAGRSTDGVCTLNSSGNIASVTRVGLGIYDIVFTTALPAGWAWTWSSSSSVLSRNPSVFLLDGETYSTTSIRIQTRWEQGSGGGHHDPTQISLMFTA